MKKFLIGIVAAMAIFALAAPAPAVMKITSQGYMEVNGIYISNNPINNDSRANDWYNMEMIVNPMLYINDNVRIISEVRIMERNWSGSGFGNSTGNQYATGAAQQKYDIFDNQQNDFWVSKLYMAFPLMGGHLYVGRMPGGSYGYAYGDSDTNADRIKWVGKVGPVTLVGVYEKSAELDGGQQAPRAGNLTGDPSWDTSDNDVDAYGIGWVVPLGKWGLYRGLSYNLRYGNPQALNAATTDHSPNWRYLWWTDVGLNFGMLKIDFAWDISWAKIKDMQLATKTDDVTYWQQTVWGEVGVTPGPFEVYAGGFWLPGEDSKDGNEDTRIGAFWNVGRDYEPNLLLFSEDMGLLYSTAGVPNGSIGSSGLRELHVRGGYKLTDTMKLTAVWDYVWLDQMEISGVDDAVGWEADLGFAWKFMPNVTYMIEGAYFSAGDYWKDTYGDNESVYGVRNTIRVEW